MQLDMDDLLIPTVEINGRIYRASNFRVNADKKKLATVEYYEQGRGWRTVQNWERMLEVADKLWPAG